MPQFIDKSKFNAEQLAQYEELMRIGKADVDPEAGEEEMEEEKPEFPPKKKSTEKKEAGCVETKKSAFEELAKSMQEQMDQLQKSIDMKEFTEMAKKYAPIGEKEEELAQRLYDMKKSDEASYTAYVGLLDNCLELVNKSGMFAEIGKSAGAYSTSGGAEAKAEAKAKEIMKADPTCSYTDAIAKAWEDPALMAEYDAEYNR